MSQDIDNRALYDANWNDWADTKTHGPANRYLLFLIRRALQHTNAAYIANVLDVGCGIGDHTYMLARTFPDANVTGIDFSTTGIHYAQSTWKAPNLEFYHHDVTSGQLNASYDLITCFEVLEHVEDWHALLERIAHASQHYIMLSFPVGRMRDYEINVGHLRNFRRGEVENFLYPLQFKPVLLQYAGFPFYSPIFRNVANLVNLNSDQDRFTRGHYGWKRKLLADMVYWSLRWASTKRHWGDKFCSLFARQS